MIEFYPQIKFVHVFTVLLSGGLFLVRGMLVLGGRQSWALAAPVRYVSYTIDTTLLTAALMLVSVLPGAIFANGWLTAKLALLVAYIVLGSFALKRGRTATVRAVTCALALLAFALMYSIARAHHPLGLLRPWLG
ncbi:hypothetical protein E4T66_20090 [Sinimarinibacterium sp. CAU 1509]|uniref:SirB2 family protein n=1 Tax=Sinimarinibacterium sp. CAU 1509 TaxID=2562283 RepID=UPI0010ACF85E|nr:SirB2 family protein [Sinimarinibacterium sp. CAU 1509]TJY56260.1 hypothetical protein E4T66_20090 [Sinimarinibacterium sp. CAU 1509]